MARSLDNKFRFSVLLLLLSKMGFCQDIHFTQFNNSPSNLNPALTGVFGGDLRFIANYRSQWSSVPVDYRTLSGAFDGKFYHRFFGRSGFLGYGLVFNNDVAGDAKLGISELGTNLAYTRIMGESLFATVGIQFRLGQRSLSPQKLSYESQWNGDLYNPDLNNGESFATNSAGLFSLSTGFNLHYQQVGKRTKIDLGAGVFHLNQPNTSFQNEPSAKLPIKASPYLLTTFELMQKLDIRANILYSKQLSYSELVAMAAIRYHVRTEKNEELSFQLGLGNRAKDAVFTSVEIQYKNWTAGFSYDLNTSPFKIATNRRGGPELSLQYVVWKVKPPKEFKACPVF